MTHKIVDLCESSALTDLKLFQFGISEYSSKNPDRSILGAHYVIHYVASGIGTVRIGNGAYSIASGSVFVLFPNQVRQIIPEENETLTIHWVELEGNVLLPEFNRLNLSSNSPMLPLHVQPHIAHGDRVYAAAGIQTRKRSLSAGSLLGDTRCTAGGDRADQAAASGQSAPPLCRAGNGFDSEKLYARHHGRGHCGVLRTKPQLSGQAVPR